MTACPFDGSVRKVAAREALAVWWRCPTCKQLTREAYDPEGDTV